MFLLWPDHSGTLGFGPNCQLSLRSNKNIFRVPERLPQQVGPWYKETFFQNNGFSWGCFFLGGTSSSPSFALFALPRSGPSASSSVVRARPTKALRGCWQANDDSLVKCPLIYIYICYRTAVTGTPSPQWSWSPPPPCGVVCWYGGCQSLMLYKGCMNKYKAYLSVCRSKKGSMKRWGFLDCNSVAKHLLPPVVVMCCS